MIQKEGIEGEINEEIPEGWIIPEIQGSTNGTVAGIRYDNVIKQNLPLVAQRTEALIEALNDRLIIPVSVTYLRIDEGSSFQALLLVDQFDYLSPKIHAARILAEKFTYANDTFDIRFLFSVKSENMIRETMKAKGYNLMRVSDQAQTAA